MRHFREGQPIDKEKGKSDFVGIVDKCKREMVEQRKVLLSWTMVLFAMSLSIASRLASTNL